MKKKTEFYLLAIFSLAVFVFLFYAFPRTGITGLSITGFSVAGQYDDYSVYITNAYEGDDAGFIIPVTNKNIDSISASTNIEIVNDTGTIISIKTAPINISANETKQLESAWVNASSGEYQARIFLFLGNESYSFTKAFKIEKKTVTFDSVIIDEFKLGEVVNFSVVLQNHLNEKMENVSVGILFFDSSGKVIGEAKSSRNDIENKSIKKFSLLWDTANIKPGKYNAKMNINYGKEVVDKDIVFDVNEDRFEVIGVGYSIAQKPQNLPSYNTFLIILTIILLAANIFWVILYIRKRKKLTK